jgi:hypothetical protein
MRLTDPLNERQLHVLRWIADGCPADAMPGHGHKHTARALQDHRLIKIGKCQGSWSAVLTALGNYYVEHGKFPSKDTALPEAPLPDRRGRDRRQQQGATPAPRATAPAKPKKPSATEKLVADVIAAGGSLEITTKPVRGRDTVWDLSRLAAHANRAGKTPPGKRLAHKVVHEGGHWTGPRHELIVLEDGPAGTDAPLVPVPVPEKVSRYHSAVSALRKAGRLDMAAAGRASRLLHAIATEADHRGFTTSAHLPQTNRDPRRETWHLLLKYGQETVPLRISEERDRVEHKPTAKELAEKARYSWTRIPDYDHIPSGRLRIDLGGPAQLERRSFWADRASWMLEDKLPELLREVAVRADDLRMRREAKARAAAEHEEAVERERKRAQARAAEAHRTEIMECQLQRWERACQLRDYIAAIDRRIAQETAASGDETTIADARKWSTWLTDVADRLNPDERPAGLARTTHASLLRTTEVHEPRARARRDEIPPRDILS